MPAKPMLDDVELQQVQKVEAEDEQVLAQHGVPALEGDFLQDLGRRVTRFTLIGVITGPKAGEKLKTLRLKFRNAEPVSFVADIATATAVGKVLIEEFGVRELAGKPARFEYELTLREFLPPPKPEQEEPPPPPPIPPDPPVDTGTLIVEVIVEGDPNFDFSKVTVTVEGTKDDGTALNQTLTTRANNVWTEATMALGQFTAKAVVTDPPAMSGSAPATVRSGAQTKVTITLRPGAIIATAFVVHFRFDNAFLEPCMREVLKQVAEFANAAANKDAKLLITGNTDEVGTPGRLTDPDPYNQSLSERRARGVFSYLTFATDAAAALKEWTALRQRQAGLPTLGDKWGARQYQYMLQALGFYPGVVDGDHGPLTDDAVRSFRQAKGLPPGTTVDDAVWNALIEDYLKQQTRKVPGAFLPNAADACNSGNLKWLGLATQDPVKNVPTAWRPNRRVELLFVRVEKLPCQSPQPDTFNLPAPGDVNATWCLGPGDKTKRTCFVVKHLPPGGAPEDEQWARQPAEPGSIKVSGTIKFEDGTPAPNVRYILIAPDGEFMDGEKSDGTGVEGRTKADGTFEYATEKGIGIYTLEIQDQMIARLEGEPQSAAKGNVVCKRLDGPAPFNVVVRKLTTVVNPIINLASAVVVVKKTHTNPARQLVTLTTDGPFFRSGTATRVGAAIRFFDAAVNGTEIIFNGTDNVFTGAQLTAGVQLFAEGATASLALDDVVLTLTLTPGATPIGPPARATMTSVLLNLDIFMTRTVAGVDGALFPQPPDPAPAPGTGTDKWFGGRFVHQQDPGSHHGRALVIVAVQPAAFAGNLSLRNVTVAADNPTGLDVRAQLFDNEIPGPRQTPPVAEAAKANPHVFNASTIPAGGLRLFVEGSSLSAALRDTGLQLGLDGGEVDGDRVRLTVMRFSNLQADIPFTPPRTARLGNTPVGRHTLTRGAGAVMVASDFDVDFATNLPLVLIENSVQAGDPINMSVVVTPVGVPVSWRALRDDRAAPIGDHVSIAGLSADPTITSTGPLTAALLTNGVGSFHVRPYVDVNGNNNFDQNIDLEPFIIMNLVLVRVTLFADNTLSPGANFARSPDPTALPGEIRVPGGPFNILAPAGDDIHMNATAELIGGGDDGLRGLDRAFAGWVNNESLNEDIVGTFRDTTVAPPANHLNTSIFASNAGVAATGAGPTFLPGNAAPALVAPPLLDSGRAPAGIGGDTACLRSSRIRLPRVTLRTAAAPAAVGQRIIVEAVDSPNDGEGTNHPGFPAALLIRFKFGLDFSAFLCFWTNINPLLLSGATADPANRLYSVLLQVDWTMRGEWTVVPATGVITTVTAPTVNSAARTTTSPAAAAVTRPVESRAPTGLNLLARDARA